MKLWFLAVPEMKKREEKMANNQMPPSLILYFSLFPSPHLCPLSTPSLRLRLRSAAAPRDPESPPTSRAAASFLAPRAEGFEVGETTRPGSSVPPASISVVGESGGEPCAPAARRGWISWCSSGGRRGSWCGCCPATRRGGSVLTGCRCSSESRGPKLRKKSFGSSQNKLFYQKFVKWFSRCNPSISSLKKLKPL